MLEVNQLLAQIQYALRRERAALLVLELALHALGQAAPLALPSSTPPPALDGDADASVPFVPTWFPCSAGPDGQMVCAIRVTFGRRGPFLQRFEFRDGRAQEGELRYSEGQATALRSSPGVTLDAGGAPGVPHPDSRLPGVGILVDGPRRRILVGAPAFLASAYLRLMFLDGEGSRRFYKTDERRSTRERVVTWRVEP